LARSTLVNREIFPILDAGALRARSDQSPRAPRLDLAVSASRTAGPTIGIAPQSTTPVLAEMVGISRQSGVDPKGIRQQHGLVVAAKSAEGQSQGAVMVLEIERGGVFHYVGFEID
jgi:hypothetical protein